MSTNSKIPGLAMVAAILAIAALPSSAAATHHPAQFAVPTGATVELYNLLPPSWTTTGQTVTCEEASFDGVAPSTKFTELAVAASYSKCKSEPLGVSATVTGFGAVGGANSCWYVFKANGGAELKCNGTGEITITAATCQAHVPAQAFASGMSYTNGTSGGKDDVTYTATQEGMEANHTDGFLCPFSSGGIGKTTVYHGLLTAIATLRGEQVDVTFLPTENTP